MYLFTHSMEQSPFRDADWFSSSQEVPHILWNLKVHYCIHKCPPPIPILSQIDPVHAPPSHFLMMYLNIILTSMPGSSKWSLGLRLTDQNPVCISALPHTCCMPYPSHSSRFDHLNNIGWRYRSLSSSLCSFLHSLVTASLLGPNILNTLFSNTLSLHSPLSVSDQVSHPFRTSGKIMVLYILIFGFLDSNLEDKRFCTEW